MFWNYTNVQTLVGDSVVYVLPSIIATAFIRAQDGTFFLEYHRSRLVSYHPDNTFTLSTCGFDTKTTLARLNTFGPVKIQKRKGKLWLIPSVGLDFDDVPFYDGIRVTAFGVEVLPEDECEMESAGQDYDATEITRDNQIGKTFL